MPVHWCLCCTRSAAWQTDSFNRLALILHPLIDAGRLLICFLLGAKEKYVETHWKLPLFKTAVVMLTSPKWSVEGLIIGDNQPESLDEWLWQTVWLKWSVILQLIFPQELRPSSDDWKWGFDTNKSQTINPEMTGACKPVKHTLL
jgi:hypothetical protein